LRRGCEVAAPERLVERHRELRAEAAAIDVAVTPQAAQRRQTQSADETAEDAHSIAHLLQCRKRLGRVDRAVLDRDHTVDLRQLDGGLPGDRGSAAPSCKS
jgi:hypothetical protein